MATEYECAECGDFFESYDVFRRHALQAHNRKRVMYNIIRNGQYCGPRFLHIKEEA